MVILMLRGLNEVIEGTIQLPREKDSRQKEQYACAHTLRQSMFEKHSEHPEVSRRD